MTIGSDEDCILGKQMEDKSSENVSQQDISSKRYFAALASLKESDDLVLCLQLSNCQIDDERLSTLFLAMEHSDTMASVDLSNNLITDNGVQVLTNILREGSIPSLIFLDIRGNPITSKAHDLLTEIQRVRKILKIYHDYATSNAKGHLPKLDEDVGIERAINLYRSKWSAACTDNGDNWLLSKSRICDQSIFSLKDRVQYVIGLLNDEEAILNTSSLAIQLKEISLLASQELFLLAQKGVSIPIEVEYSEGTKYFVGNLRYFISMLDMDPSREDMGGQGAGLHRIAVVELLHNVILYCLPMVEEGVFSSGILTKLLQLFCNFPQNSILHCAVFRCLQVILSQSNTTLFWSLVQDACLPSFLAREGTKCSAVPQGGRPSYCGHIFGLSKTLRDLEETDASLMDFLKKNKEWLSYVGPDGPFRKMHAEQAGDLCGPRPVLSRLVTNFLQNPTRNLVQVNQFTV